MTESQVVNQQQVHDTKPSDKEINFRAMEAKHRREMEEMKSKVDEAERKAQEASRKQVVEDDEDDEPYVAHKKLDKKLAKFGQNTQSDINKAMEQAKQAAKYELKQELWLEKHPDFVETMKAAQKLYEKDQELAETILEMPDTFERQKLVYKNIKALGLDKPAPKESSIQEKIDANRRSPYYIPGGPANPPYAMAGDFSPAGQKNAYAKMKELQKNVKI
jgi:hypothetical protein